MYATLEGIGLPTVTGRDWTFSDKVTCPEQIVRPERPSTTTASIVAPVSMSQIICYLSAAPLSQRSPQFISATRKGSSSFPFAVRWYSG